MAKDIYVTLSGLEGNRTGHASVAYGMEVSTNLRFCYECGKLGGLG